MSETESYAAVKTDRTIHVAAWLALAGLVLVLVFMIAGFAPWSVGLGVFLGVPLLAAAMVLYIVAVVRDLRRREAL